MQQPVLEAYFPMADEIYVPFPNGREIDIREVQIALEPLDIFVYTDPRESDDVLTYGVLIAKHPMTKSMVEQAIDDSIEEQDEEDDLDDDDGDEDLNYDEPDDLDDDGDDEEEEEEDGYDD